MLEERHVSCGQHFEALHSLNLDTVSPLELHLGNVCNAHMNLDSKKIEITKIIN